MADLALTQGRSIPRNALFAASMVLGLANGLIESAYRNVAQDGAWAALGETFGVSAIVWVAAFIGLDQLFKSRREPASRIDLLVAGAACLAFFIPASKFSWVVLTALSLYVAGAARDDAEQRKGAAIVLAITFPMFWSKLLFAVISRWLLIGDATLVAAVTGLKRVGNTLELGGGYGQLWIASGCSSLANVSLSVLCWSVFVTLFKQSRPRRAMLVCVAAGLAVIVINVCRISMMALRPAHYELLHGPIGSTVAGWLTTLAIVGICAVWLDHGDGVHSPPPRRS